MTNDTSLPELRSDVHTYKIKLWLNLINLSSLVFFGIIIGIPLVFISVLLMSISRSETSFGAVETSFLCAFAPLAAALGLLIIQQVFNIISAFFSYIKISPEGIEHKVWPYRHIRANWSQVERLGQFFYYEVIYLKSFDIIGPSLSHSWPLKFLNLFQTSIALSTYNGWPNGELASDLKRYAPQLFENRQVTGVQPGAQDSSISQEGRLLAALSHASVLFTGVGTVVPLVIYITQKQKSAYLAFHALQAFIYQLAGTIIGILFPFCMIGAILLPAIGASLPGSENAFGPFFLVTMAVTGVVAVLVAFGSIGYIAYGIIGAILAYQGKDFRYVVIGKRVEHRG